MNNVKSHIAIIVAIFASYCIALNIFKVASTSTLIMANFGLDAREVGSLVSITGVVGIFLGLPSGVLVSKFGPRIIGIVAIATIVFLSVSGFNGGTNYMMSYCDFREVNTDVASELATLRSVFVIAASVITGFIIAPLNTKRKAILLIFAACLILISFVVMWKYTNRIEAIISMIIIGSGISVMPAIVTTLTPVISGDDKLVGVTNGFIALGQNLGGVSVALITGRLLDFAGFEALTILYSIFGLIIVACSIFLYNKIKNMSG